METRSPQTSVGNSSLQWLSCQKCQGFGYQVTPAKQHIRCSVCHNQPSVYGLYGGELLFWSPIVSASGIAERRVLRMIHMTINALLLLVSAFGVVSIVAAGYLAVKAYEDAWEIFLEPSPLVAFFWFAALCAMFFCYRLVQERVSHKTFDYSLKATEKREKLATEFSHPAQRTHTGYHKLPTHHKVDVYEYYTQPAIQTVETAYALARDLNHHIVTPLHLFAALQEQSTVQVIMLRLGVDAKELLKRIGSAIAKEGAQQGEDLDMGLEAKQMLLYAYEEAMKSKQPYVDVTELLIAIVEHDLWAQEILDDLSIESRMIRNCVQWSRLQHELRHRMQHWRQKAARKPKGVMDRAMTARPSPLLQSISHDFTSTAAMGGFFPLIGRDDEMDQMVRILRDRIGSILLVGPPGVGKSQLLEGFADRLAAEEVPRELQDKRFVVLDPGALIADAKGVGTVEGRMQKVVYEIARAGNIILGIEDVHHLVNMRSTSGSEDVASMLMNAMSEGRIKVVATTTTEEYQQFIQNRGPLLRRFHLVQVGELGRDDSIEVLEARAGSIEYKFHVFLSYAAIEAAVDLTTQFIQDRYLPSKALDILTETASYVESERGQNVMVTAEDVAAVVAKKTNVQVTAITQDEREKLLNLEVLMHERVVGQDVAITAIASALRRARQGLRDMNRPIANFLFLGPTGVGKTETAKTIAEIYFGNEQNMIRLDMSEYQTPGSIYKLIGGNGERGVLTEAVRLKPFALVLLDELEKAHPDVLNLFLQVMDDARLTDGAGKTVNLSNVMVIATSNAGTQQIQNSFNAGLNAEQIEARLVDSGALANQFSPEFLNRFDRIVVFKPLTQEEVVVIAERLLSGIAARLQEEKSITMQVTPEAVMDVATRGYDPKFGARPLKRVIQDTVDDALAKLLLSEKVGRRDTVILRAGGELEIVKADRLV